MTTQFTMRPGARKDFGIVWTDDLAPGETVITSRWECSSIGVIAVLTDYIEKGETIVWVEAIQDGRNCILTNTITTSRTMPDGRPRVEVCPIEILVRLP